VRKRKAEQNTRFNIGVETWKHLQNLDVEGIADTLVKNTDLGDQKLARKIAEIFTEKTGNKTRLQSAENLLKETIETVAHQDTEQHENKNRILHELNEAVKLVSNRINIEIYDEYKKRVAEQKLHKLRSIWLQQKHLEHLNRQTKLLENTLHTLETFCTENLPETKSREHYEACYETLKEKNPNRQIQASLAIHQENHETESGTVGNLDLQMSQIDLNTNHTGVHFVILPEQWVKREANNLTPVKFQALQETTLTLQTACKLYTQGNLTFEESLEAARHIWNRT